MSNKKLNGPEFYFLSWNVLQMEHNFVKQPITSEIQLWSAWDTFFWWPKMPRISPNPLAVKNYAPLLLLSRQFDGNLMRRLRKEEGTNCSLGELGRKLPYTKTPLNFSTTVVCPSVFPCIPIIILVLVELSIIYQAYYMIQNILKRLGQLGSCVDCVPSCLQGLGGHQAKDG